MASPGELWLTDFGEPFPGEPAHHRPSLVLGPPPSFGSDFPYVLLCPLTTTHHGLSLHVEIEAAPATGLDTTSYVQCELLRSVSRTRLVLHLGTVDAPSRHHVHDILQTLLGH